MRPCASYRYSTGFSVGAPGAEPRIATFVTRSRLSSVSRTWRPAGEVVVHVAGGPAEKTRVVTAFERPVAERVDVRVCAMTLNGSPGVASVAVRDSVVVIECVVVGKPTSVFVDLAKEAVTPHRGSAAVSRTV